MGKDGWVIEKLYVHYCDYGDHKGKHTGSVEFRNQNKDSFVFQLTPEKVSDYMDLIRKDVVETAGSLGSLLAEGIRK